MSNDRWMETMNTPPLETNRLILRKFSIGDLPAIFDIFSDKEANEYLPWFPLESMEQALALFDRRQPKNLLVTFRMYQMNLDGNNMRVFRGYWDMHPVHFIEGLQPASSG